MAAPEILTRAEAAELLRVSVDTLDRLVTRPEGGIPAFRVGHQVRFRREDLDRWLESQRVGGSGSAPKRARTTFGSATKGSATRSPRTGEILARLPRLSRWWIDHETSAETGFRNDRPRYRSLAMLAERQQLLPVGAFDVEDEEDALPCACTD